MMGSPLEPWAGATRDDHREGAGDDRTRSPRIESTGPRPSDAQRIDELALDVFELGPCREAEARARPRSL